MAEDRYYVDERCGIIAVMDREKADPKNYGLHPDTPGVVMHWMGFRANVICKECGHTKHAGWVIPNNFKTAAAELCNKLNKENNNGETEKETKGRKA